MHGTTIKIQRLLLFLLYIAALNNFILFKIYTRDQNQMDKGYAINDFTLDCVQKTTDDR
jgi:hypothetical protein